MKVNFSTSTNSDFTSCGYRYNTKITVNTIAAK